MPTKKYTVTWKKKTDRSFKKLPPGEQKKLYILIQDLQDKGPYREEWPNYSPLGDNAYHCHLSYNWVACWYWEKRTIRIEVTYAGSREKAPY